MRVLSITLVAFFALFEVVSCGELHKSPWAKRHNPRFALLEDAATTTKHNNTYLEKRVDGAKFTYYAAGLGACGTVNIDSDFIVAINAAQYDGGAHCYEHITITVNGKTTQAQITDECLGCPQGGLDLSGGLFSFFAPQAQGVLTGSWSFVGAATPSPTPTPTPTPTLKPSPSSTSVVTPTSTFTYPPTSTLSSTSSSVSTSTNTSVSIPTPTPSLETGNIADLYLAYIQIGLIAMVIHGEGT